MRHIETEMQFQLLKAQKDEETLWKNESHVSWLTTLDLNTRFFLLSTIVRQN